MRKLLRLTAAERRHLLVALLLLWAVRLALWMLPFRAVLRHIADSGLAPDGPGRTNPQLVERDVWVVKVASRYVPRATCLTQAVTLMLLLRRHGQPASLRIGVARDGSAPLSAHAWVESQGRVLIGDTGRQRYTPLPTIC